MMADYISREAAYKTLTEYYRHSSGVQHTVLREALNRVPAADVRPVKRGRWINAYPKIEPNPMYMYGICSECGFEQSISNKLNYCPNCGADMREVSEDG